MARIRNVKPEFFLHADLAECSPLARLLFIGTWTLADRNGVLKDRPKQIKAQILPYDDCDPVQLLDELADRGFIVRYKVGDGDTTNPEPLHVGSESVRYKVGDGDRLIFIPKFRNHQTFSGSEKAGVLPMPNPLDAGRAGGSEPPATEQPEDWDTTNPEPLHVGSESVASPLGDGVKTGVEQKNFADLGLRTQDIGHRTLDGPPLAVPACVSNESNDPTDRPLTAEQFRDEWNRTLPWAAFEHLPPNRGRLLRTRLPEPGWLKRARLAMARANASQFLRGNGTGFKLTIDWFLDLDNLTKILEGNYDRGSPEKRDEPTADPDLDLRLANAAERKRQAREQRERGQ